MALKLRGVVQIQDASIELSKIKDISSGKLIGRPEESSLNYNAENAAPSEISGEDIRRIAELHIDDNVHFANLESDAITATSTTLAGALSAASADLNDGQLDAGAANLASATISGDVSASNTAFSGTLSSGAATLASAAVTNALTSGSISSSGILSSAGKATLNSLEVTNDADLLGDATISGDLSAVNTAFSGTLSSGAATLASAAVTNALVSGSIASNGTLSSAGKATLNSLEVTNDADILGAASVTGDLSAASADFGSGSLEAGAATLASAVISGDINVDNATFSADLSAANAAFSGTLSAGASTLASAAIAGAVSAGSFSSSDVNIDGGSIDGTAIGEDVRASGKFSIVDITGSMTVGANLSVSGSTATVNTDNLIIKDPMIQMGEGNSSDAVDLGFVGQYDSSSYAGLVRDANDSGKFKLFYTDEDLSTSQTVDFSSATKATLDADIKGNIQYDVAKDWSMSGDIVAAAVPYNGTGNVELSAIIQPDSVEYSMLDCAIDEDDMSSNSASHLPTQQSVKKYVDDQVALAGLNAPDPKVYLIVDSSESFVGVKDSSEYKLVSSTDESNEYVTLSTGVDDEFKSLSKVYLNGKRLKYSYDNGTNDDFWFSGGESATGPSSAKIDSLGASDEASGDLFGHGSAISKDGNVLVVGAASWDGSATDQGGVYIYDWNSSNEEWDQRGSVLTASDAGIGDRFGASVSANSDGSIIAVGAVMWDGSTTTDQGAVYVYEYISNSWTQKGSIITHSDAGAEDYHVTCSLSSDGTILAVGSQGWDASGGSNEGAVYLYDWDDLIEEWIQRPYGALDETTSSETDLVNEHNGSSTNGIYVKSLEYLENGIVLAGTYTAWNSNGSGRLYRSTDNGENWTSVKTFSNINTVNVIKYLGDGIVLAATAGNSSDGDVYRSTDSGLNWTRVSNVSAHEAIENLEYLGDGICIFGAGYSNGDGYIYRSTDYGATWAKTDTSNSIWGNSKRAATFKYLGNGICMGSRMTNSNVFRLIRSTDYGATWSDIGQTTLLTDYSSSFPCIEYLGDGKVAVVATWTTSRVYISSDYGQTFDTTAKFTVSEWALSMEHLGNGRVVLGTYSGSSSTESNSGKLYESTDYGQTWNSTAIFSPGVKRIVTLRLNPENNTLLVGCKDNSSNPTVYILGDTSPVKNLTPSDAASGDVFGYGVSLSSDGTILAIGARDWEGSYTNQGGVYIYDWNSSSRLWVQRGDVLVSNFEGSGIEAFGMSTELNGDGTVLAVGQIGSWSSQSNKQVEIFDWNSSTSSWDYRIKIDAPDDSTRTASQSSFSVSVSMNSSATKLVVGACNDNSNKGYVYTYTLSEGESATTTKINFKSESIFEDDKLEINYITKI